MPKVSRGYIKTFEMAVSRLTFGLCPASAIKRMNAILSELKHNPQACRDYLEKKVFDIGETCLKRHVCPDCNTKLLAIRDESKDEFCFFQGSTERTKTGYQYKCTHCNKVFDID